MFNDRGEAISEAGPATPVEVLGLQGVPEAGESFQVVADVSRAQQISHHRQYAERQRTLIKSTKRGIEALGETEVKELLVIIKADVQGSVEVLKSTLEKMSTREREGKGDSLRRGRDYRVRRPAGFRHAGGLVFERGGDHRL